MIKSAERCVYYKMCIEKLANLFSDSLPKVGRTHKKCWERVVTGEDSQSQRLGWGAAGVRAATQGGGTIAVALFFSV